MSGRDALLIVDVQNDFCPGGALAVPEGDQVVEVLNTYVRRFRERGLPVFASRDWHPVETRHFEEWGGPWPPHCVAGSDGAELHPGLELPGEATLVSKGTDPEDDGYSAFEAATEAGEMLDDALRRQNVSRLFVGGLATDYCVRASVLDATARGLQPVLLLDAMKGIDVEPGDQARALDEMLRAGATTATIDTLDDTLDETLDDTLDEEER